MRHIQNGNTTDSYCLLVMKIKATAVIPPQSSATKRKSFDHFSNKRSVRKTHKNRQQSSFLKDQQPNENCSIISTTTFSASKPNENCLIKRAALFQL